MAISDLPRGPTVNRVEAYLKAAVKAALAPPIDIEAIQMRPRTIGLVQGQLWVVVGHLITTGQQL